MVSVVVAMMAIETNVVDDEVRVVLVLVALAMMVIKTVIDD